MGMNESKSLHEVSMNTSTPESAGQIWKGQIFCKLKSSADEGGDGEMGCVLTPGLTKIVFVSSSSSSSSFFEEGLGAWRGFQTSARTCRMQKTLHEG